VNRSVAKPCLGGPESQDGRLEIRLEEYEQNRRVMAYSQERMKRKASRIYKEERTQQHQDREGVGRTADDQTTKKIAGRVQINGYGGRRRKQGVTCPLGQEGRTR